MHCFRSMRCRGAGPPISLRARPCTETLARLHPTPPHPGSGDLANAGHTWRGPPDPAPGRAAPGTLSAEASAAEQGHGGGASGGRLAGAPSRGTVPASRRIRTGVRPGPLPDGAAAGRGAGRGGHGGAADRRVRAATGARPRLRRPAHLLWRAAGLHEPAGLDPLVHRQHRNLAPGARARLRPAALGARPPGAQALSPLVGARLRRRRLARRSRLPGRTPRHPRALAVRSQLPPRAPAARHARGRARGGRRRHRVSPR